jgi:hypothetical protein
MSLPCIGQRTEVVVESSKMVQVSTGEQSPNITEVGNATIYYITCYYTVYCGPPSQGSSSSTYTFASVVPATAWYMPSSSSSPLASILSQPISSDLLSTFQSSSSIYDSYSGATGGFHLTGFPVTGRATLGSTTQDGDQTQWASAISKFAATRDALEGLQSLYTETSPGESSVGNPPMIIGTTGPTWRDLLIKQTSPASYPSSCSQPAEQEHGISICGVTSEPPYTYYPTLFHPSTDSTNQILERTLSQSDFTGNYSPLLGGSLANPSTSEYTWLNSMLGVASSGFSSEPISLSDSVFGSGYDYSKMGLSSNANGYGFSNPYRSVSGTDAESLSRQVGELGQSKAKVVAWTVLYEPASNTDQSQ